MLNLVKGLHHVTAMARDARANNAFFTRTLGLRRVKKTVNFDAPDIYHLYYADAAGTPGTVMTYFPFPHIARARPGTGEVGATAFSVPQGALGYWEHRLAAHGVNGLKRSERFGEKRLSFQGPDEDALELVETQADPRAPWIGADVGAGEAIRGFHSVSMRLADGSASAELLKFMGYREVESAGDTRRFAIAGDGNGADLIDIETVAQGEPARQGAGSVHHVAFAVEDRPAQRQVLAALADAGHQVTPVIDRNYFWSIYFRAPGGVLFEVATNEPGFGVDEEEARLGEALKLPARHEHMRAFLETHLPPLEP